MKRVLYMFNVKNSGRYPIFEVIIYFSVVAEIVSSAKFKPGADFIKQFGAILYSSSQHPERNIRYQHASLDWMTHIKALILARSAACIRWRGCNSARSHRRTQAYSRRQRQHQNYSDHGIRVKLCLLRSCIGIQAVQESWSTLDIRQEKISAPRRATSGHSLHKHAPASGVDPAKWTSQIFTRHIVHDHLLLSAI